MLLSRLLPSMLLPRAVLLAADVILLSISEEASVDGRFTAGLEPPYGTVAVRSASGAHQIAAMRLSQFHSTPAGSRLSVAIDAAQTVDSADPFNTVVLGSDVTELAEELDVPSQRRLLAFLLGFCGKAFSLGDDQDFGSACFLLAKFCVPICGTAESVATVMNTWAVVAGLPYSREASLFILDSKRVRRSVALPVEDHAGLMLTEQISAGDVLFTQGEQPALFLVGAMRQDALDLLRTSPGPAGLRAACLRILAPRCPKVAAYLREAAVLSPAAPRRHDDVSSPIGVALEMALPDGNGSVFLRGWVRDPMNLVAAMELKSFFGTVPLRPEDLHRFRRPDIDRHFATAAFCGEETRLGFVAYVRNPGGVQSLQPTLSLRLKSGARVEARASLRHLLPAVARTAVLASVSPEDVTDPMLDSCLGPAAASFHQRSLAARGTPEVIRIGTASARSTLSVIVPLYRNLSFLRFQIAAMARDPECRDAEFIFVLDSPEQSREVEHLLRGLHAMHGLPLTLAILSRNLGYAAANNAGAAIAQADHLLFLNSDVIPASQIWLGPLKAALTQEGVGAAGPKLLFDDDSIQHAGLFFQRDVDGLWLNAHYDKGMPRSWPGATQPRRVPGITGAAMLVHRHWFEAVNGFCEDYIVGDYEDSDFCLRLHAAGARISYVPSAELYHFERRSISLHKGYSGTLACRYNRRLHHRRWDATIEALMAEPDIRSAGLTP